MGTVIVCLVFCVCVVFALRGSVHHMKGEGGCCGGDAPQKVKRQKLKQVNCVKEIQVEGMECKNCSQRVANALNELSGVNASVDLKSGLATVKMQDEIPDEELQRVIRQAGYRAVTVTRKEQ